MLSLLTYNIRFDTPKDGENAWQHRRDDVCAFIRTCAPDIFCVQEVMDNQKTDLMHAFPAFGLVGVGRDDGWTAGEMVNIFYNLERFEKQANGDFWLSDTPDVMASCTWGNRLPRLASWIKLYDRKAGKVLFVFNTHLDHESQEARAKSVELLHQKIQDIAGKEQAFLTGDFNLTPAEAPYKKLTEYFLDLRTVAPEKPIQTTTFNGFGDKGIASVWIDYVFASQVVEVLSYEVLETKLNGRFPSDHFPILVKVL